MNLSDQDILLIEKYLDNELSEDETFLVKERRSQSVVFEQQIRLAESTILSLQNSNNTQLKAELKQIFNEAKQEEYLNKIGFKSYLAVAASIGLFILSAIAIYHIALSANVNLYSSYYEVYPPSPVTRGDIANDLTSVMVLYRSGNFQEALLRFEELIESDPKKSMLLIYIGNCQLNLDNDDQAISTFKIAQKSDDIIIRYTANWYLSLAYLKTEDIDGCKNQLICIVNGNEIYSSKAQELLGKIK